MVGCSDSAILGTLPIVTALAQIRIVLVEPAGARNVGSVARVLKNFGLQQLWLVHPRCDWQGEEAYQMAVHGGDRLTAAQVVPDLASALQGCERIVATTGQVRSLPVELHPPRQVLPWLLGATGPTALIFGREDRGLDRQELDLAQRYLTIPTDPAYSSLNLAQAVGLCCYELHVAAVTPPERVPAVAAAFEQVEAYYSDLAQLLLKIGYLHPHTATDRLAKLRRLYARTDLRAQELAMLRGMVRQMAWAIAHPEQLEQ
jgi:tRNA/rRNA methyltransferase